MDKLQLLLKENWEILQELFELPNNISTKVYGDDFFSNKGEYGEFFEFHHDFTGNSGKVHRMTFKFNLKSTPHPVNEGGKSINLDLQDRQAPVYEVAFYPEEKSGRVSQWKLLNDVEPTKVFVTMAYFMIHHASSLAKEAIPTPFVKYIYKPITEENEKTNVNEPVNPESSDEERNKKANDNKRGRFYLRALPHALSSLSGMTNNLKISNPKPLPNHPEFTMITIQMASH